MRRWDARSFLIDGTDTQCIIAVHAYILAMVAGAAGAAAAAAASHALAVGGAAVFAEAGICEEGNGAAADAWEAGSEAAGACEQRAAGICARAEADAWEAAIWPAGAISYMGEDCAQGEATSWAAATWLEAAACSPAAVACVVGTRVSAEAAACSMEEGCPAAAAACAAGKQASAEAAAFATEEGYGVAAAAAHAADCEPAVVVAWLAATTPRQLPAPASMLPPHTQQAPSVRSSTLSVIGSTPSRSVELCDETAEVVATWLMA